MGLTALPGAQDELCLTKAQMRLLMVILSWIGSFPNASCWTFFAFMTQNMETESGGYAETRDLVLGDLLTLTGSTVGSSQFSAPKSSSLNNFALLSIVAVLDFSHRQFFPRTCSGEVSNLTNKGFSWKNEEQCPTESQFTIAHNAQKKSKSEQKRHNKCVWCASFVEITTVTSPWWT